MLVSKEDDLDCVVPYERLIAVVTPTTEKNNAVAEPNSAKILEGLWPFSSDHPT